MNRFKKGSITVEAAFILPFFIVFFLQLYSVFEMISVYCRIEVALEETAEETATILYLNEDGQENGGQSFVLTQIFVREELIRKVGKEFLGESVLVGGPAGLTLLQSEIGEGEVNLVVSYQVKPWYSLGKIGTIRLMNHCKVSAWTGYEKPKGGENSSEDEQTVYVTPSGSVYHLYRDCTYLDAHVTAVYRDEVADKRNESGEKYYACELCSKEGAGEEICYITPYGNRYHFRADCNALHKKVSAVSLHETGGKHVCSKCKARRENESTDD